MSQIRSINEIKAEKEAIGLLSKAIEICHFSGISQNVVNHLIYGLAMAEAECASHTPYIPVRGAITQKEYDEFAKNALSKKPVQANDLVDAPPIRLKD